jgi:hypothetical protein
VGTNSAATGAVRINGTTHGISRLRKDEDKIVFFTGTAELQVRKFVNGTGTGVYTDLAITTAIVLGAMAGGIESMWIVPWAHGTYDIGQTARRFRSLYLSGEVVAGSLSATTVSATTVSGTTVNGNVNAQGTGNKMWGAVFN